jgi:hypothetical protein
MFTSISVQYFNSMNITRNMHSHLQMGMFVNLLGVFHFLFEKVFLLCFESVT